MYYAWRVAICFICARTAQLVCVQLKSVESLVKVYNRKKVYNSVFTHTLSSHLALAPHAPRPGGRNVETYRDESA